MNTEIDKSGNSGSGQRPNFEEPLRALRQWDGGVPGPAIFYGFSDMDEVRLERFGLVWQEVQPARRASLLRHLTEAGESNVDLNYRAPGMLALRDPAAAVRRAAIELLWEDESRELLRELLVLTQRDQALSVRSAAASALGRYVLAAELGKIESGRGVAVQQVLSEIWLNHREDSELRRRALESLANSSAAIVPGAILEAWRSDDHELRASALYAMGRSCDQRWEEIVLDALRHDDPALRYEAVRASGDLEILTAVPVLGELLQDQDAEIRGAAIQALGDTGGSSAISLLQQLAAEAEEESDETLLEAVEEALENASFGNLDINPDFGN
ncbi:MAG: HEAT repeat domain-containing protein [Anaerolineaceae bacterium]|nr:HEAT repeat domain-containing protein [Anaerolineaceae bacterium]